MRVLLAPGEGGADDVIQRAEAGFPSGEAGAVRGRNKHGGIAGPAPGDLIGHAQAGHRFDRTDHGQHGMTRAVAQTTLP